MSNDHFDPFGRRDRSARRALAFFIVAAMLAGLLVSCQPTKHKVDANKRPLIGFSLDSLVVERWKRDLDVFSRAAKDLGADIIVRVADQDVSIQIRQIRELLDSGIDVLVIVPNDAELLSGAVRNVKSRGIPVLSYDRLVLKAGVDLYISFDNEKVGYLMASGLLRSKPEGNYVIINGARSDNNAILINRGIHSALKEAVSHGKVRILTEAWPGTWDSEEARRAMEAAVAKSVEIDGIIAGNDMLAEAAIGVLAENRLMGRASIVGQDAELSACQRIAEGLQLGTIYKPIDRLALTAAGFAVGLARGEAVGTGSTIDDGKGQVPYIRLDPILVTKENLDATIIHDGFHSSAEVYKRDRP